MKYRKALITGGAGLIGSHIVDQLVCSGVEEVIVLDNFVRGRRENLAWTASHGSVKIVEGDIRDKLLLAGIIQDIDVIFHQAAIRITQCAEDARLALEVMVDGTFNVLEAAVRAKVSKVVVASSASVYGLAECFPTDEKHHHYNNRTLYGAAKAFNEGLLRSFYDMYGLNYIALRYFNVYGPRMDTHGAYTEVFIRWMECISRGQPPLILGDGTQTMDFVYVEDVARANILAAAADITDEQFNIANGKEISLNDLANVLLKIMGSNLRPEYGPQRKINPVSRRLANIGKAKKLLGFEPLVSFEEGLRRLVLWWKEEISEHKSISAFEPKGYLGR